MKLNSTISIGNILTLIFIVGSAFLTTAEIVHTVDIIAERISVVEVRVSTLETSLSIEKRYTHDSK